MYNFLKLKEYNNKVIRIIIMILLITNFNYNILFFILLKYYLIY